MRIFLLTLITLICSISVDGQQGRIDSLIRHIAIAKHDSQTVKLYLELGDAYENINSDSALLYFLKTIEIADANNDYKASNVFKETKATALRWSGNVHYYLGNFNKANEYYIESLKINESLGDSTGMSRSYNNIGLMYSLLGNYQLALEYHQKSLEIKTAANDFTGMAASYSNIGHVFLWQGSFERSLENFLESLRLYDLVGNRLGVASSYNDIGNMYEQQKSFSLALDYNLKSLEIREEINDYRGLARSYNDVGNILRSTQRYKEAIEYYNKSLKIKESLGDRLGMAYSYGNLGIIMENLGDLKKALEYSEKSLQLYTEVGDKRGVAESYYDIANSHQKLGNLSIAKQYYLKSYSIAVEIGTIPQQKNAAEGLKIIYEKLGDYKRANQYANEFIALNDSIYSQETARVIAEMGVKYEIETKQLLIDNLNKEKELQDQIIARNEAEAKKQRILSVSLLVGFILVLIFSSFLYSLFLHKKRANILLAQQKSQIENQNLGLQQANEEISSQRDLVLAQKKILEKINNHMTDSLRYAQSIQAAILPSEKILQQISPDYFVTMKPCELVSGDFFWATAFNEYQVFCVADCTGHGVPGAFMSILGITALNDIVARHRIIKPSEILGHLRQSVIETLSQNDYEQLHKDGMDIALCVLNTKTREMQFAGAGLPLWAVTDKPLNTNEKHNQNEPLSLNGVNLYEVKGDSMPVGQSPRMKPFTDHSFKLNDHSIKVYLVTDGFADQIGGQKRAKFGLNRLKKLILETSNQGFKQQQTILDQEFDAWKGDVFQVDDVAVLGIKV